MRTLRNATVEVHLLLALLIALGTSLPLLGMGSCSKTGCAKACGMHVGVQDGSKSCCANGVSASQPREAASPEDDDCTCEIRSEPERVPLQKAAATQDCGQWVAALLPFTPGLTPEPLAIASAAEVIPHEQSPPSAVRPPDRGRAPPVA